MEERVRKEAGRWSEEACSKDTGWTFGGGPKSERSEQSRGVFWKQNMQDMLVILIEEGRREREEPRMTSRLLTWAVWKMVKPLTEMGMTWKRMWSVDRGKSREFSIRYVILYACFTPISLMGRNYLQKPGSKGLISKAFIFLIWKKKKKTGRCNHIWLI